MNFWGEGKEKWGRPGFLWNSFSSPSYFKSRYILVLENTVISILKDDVTSWLPPSPHIFLLSQLLLPSFLPFLLPSFPPPLPSFFFSFLGDSISGSPSADFLPHARQALFYGSFTLGSSLLRSQFTSCGADSPTGGLPPALPNACSIMGLCLRASTPAFPFSFTRGISWL